MILYCKAKQTTDFYMKARLAWNCLKQEINKQTSRQTDKRTEGILWDLYFVVSVGIINLVRTQNFPKNYYFLPPDTHTYVYVSGGKKC